MSINLSKIDSKYFCAAPWVNIHINFSGYVKPCCHGNQTGYSSVAEDEWTYTSSSHPALSELKTQLVSGIEPAYCKGCVERGWYNEFLDPDLIVNQINSFDLQSIDVRWSTTCQLSCTYCNQWNSSTWGQLEHKANRTIPIQGRAYKPQYDRLFNFISEHKHKIKRVNMLGGEPLLIKENQLLLDCINPDTHVEVFTNLNMDLPNNVIYKKLISRNHVTWRISMENVGERFEFVRRGSDWDTQVKNITKLNRDITNSNSVMYLHSQFCAYSATRMPELYDFVYSMSNVNINWSTMMNDPAVLNFFNYPAEHKQKCLSDIQNLKTQFNEPDVELVDLNDISNKLTQSMHVTSQKIITDCVAFHAQQEKKYFNNRFNFLDLWPEYKI